MPESSRHIPECNWYQKSFSSHIIPFALTCLGLTCSPKSSLASCFSRTYQCGTWIMHAAISTNNFCMPATPLSLVAGFDCTESCFNTMNMVLVLLRNIWERWWVTYSVVMFVWRTSSAGWYFLNTACLPKGCKHCK